MSNYNLPGGDSKTWEKVLPGESMGKNIYNSLLTAQIHFPLIWAPAVQKFLPKKKNVANILEKDKALGGL